MAFQRLLVSLLLLSTILYGGYVKVIMDDNEVWWFEHNGHKFLSFGVNHVNNGGFDDGVGGQESAICQARTNNSLCGDTLSFCGVLGYSPYYNNTQSLYDNNATKWAAQSTERMQSWNMNTISGWSSTLMEQTISKNELYYAHLLDMGTTWITHADGLDYDVYSDAFYTHCDSIGQSQVLPRANDEYLLGWQLDNEIWWHRIGLHKYLNYSITSDGFNASILFLQNKYKHNLTELNLKWDIHASDWTDLHYQIHNVSFVNPFFEEDNEEFLYLVCVQYFNVTVGAIKRYDSNHLILGVRNFETPKYALLAMKDYVDTIDKHCYGNPQLNVSCPMDNNPCHDLDDIYNEMHKPIFIGEFSFVSKQSNNPNCDKGARHHCDYPTQMDRANSFEHFVNVLMSKKYAIGYHWWQYADEPEQGRWPDGENCNYGLVDINDNPWTDLVDRITDVNPTLYDLHANA